MLDEYSIEQRATQILDAPSKESGRRNWGMAVNIGEQIGEQIAKSHCQFDLKSMTCGDDSVDASPPYLCTKAARNIHLVAFVLIFTIRRTAE